MLRDRDLRLRLLVAAAVATLVVAVLLIMRLGASSRTGAAGNAVDAGVLGIGRSLVLITPGTLVAGELGIPRGIDADALSWSVDGADLHLHGTGGRYSFTAPQSGELVMKVAARGAGKAATTTTTFRVVGATELAVSEVRIRGEVMINGGRAVQGEGLRTGTRIDARMGEISFRSLASIDGNLGGRTSYRGTTFSVSAQRSGTRVMNIVTVQRDRVQTRSLHAEVEHLNNARYVSVQTPDAVAMVKGTGFDVTVTPGTSLVSVDHGVVFTVDRYRMFALPRELRAGESHEIEAMDDGLSDVASILTPAGDALTVLAEQNPDLHPHADVPRSGDGGEPEAVSANGVNDAIVHAVLTSEVEKVPAPVVVTGAGDAGSPGGTSTAGTTSGTDSNQQTGGGTSDAGQGQGQSSSQPSGSSDTNDATSKPLPPPVDRAYMLGDFAGWPRCRPDTHLLWNGSYRDDPARLRCVLRTDFKRIVQPGRGYLPPKGWGCYRFHGRWNAEQAWCYPLSPTAIAALGSYVLPRGWDDDAGRVVRMPVCSDDHSLLDDAFCHRNEP